VSKKFLIVLIAVLLVLVGSVLAYQQYMVRQPQYSLKCLGEACKAHDLQGFRKYVAVDDVVSSAVDDLLVVIAAEDQAKSKNEWEQLGSAMGAGLIQIMKPSLIQQAKANIERSVETGDFNNLQFGDAKSASVSGEDIGNISVGKVNIDGKVAHVDMEIYSSKEKRTTKLDIVMRNMGDYWQIASIGNLKDILLQARHLAK